MTAPHAHRPIGGPSPGLPSCAVAEWDDNLTVATNLALWARSRHTGAADLFSAGALARLLEATERASSRAMALRWLAAVVAAPDEGACRAVDFLLMPFTLAERQRRFGWLAVGPLGPLAWAAGVSLVEAAGRTLDETLNADRLRTLAGLRGWRFPPITGDWGAW